MNLPFGDSTLFITGSLVVAWMSRKPLRQPKSHGYYRFFAAEFLLLLLVLNRSPVGDQTLADTLLYLSATLVILGYGTLRLLGNVSATRSEEALLAFEKTTTLVTGGIFRFIRHPMYTSLMALGWGFVARDPSWTTALLAGLVSLLLFLTALADERECLAYFGEPYAGYMKRTRRFVPFIF